MSAIASIVKGLIGITDSPPPPPPLQDPAKASDAADRERRKVASGSADYGGTKFSTPLGTSTANPATEAALAKILGG